MIRLFALLFRTRNYLAGVGLQPFLRASLAHSSYQVRVNNANVTKEPAIAPPLSCSWIPAFAGMTVGNAYPMVIRRTWYHTRITLPRRLLRGQHIPTPCEL